MSGLYHRPMRWPRASLARKIAVANIALALFAVLLTVGLEYRKERHILKSTMNHELTQFVISGALLMNGRNVEEVMAEPRAVKSQELQRVLRSLLGVNPAVARMYVIARRPDGRLRVLLVQGESGAKQLAPQLMTGVNDCLNQGTPLMTQAYEGSRGRWVSALHPLRDPRGQVVAVLGADLRASDLTLEARERLRSTLLSGLAAVAVAIVLSFLMARGVTRPLKMVAASTSEIASGNLNVCINIRSRDEIGELARSFNQMVERLARAADERDRLQQEVVEKQKLEHELSLAAEIQQSFLPVTFPSSFRFKADARAVPAQVVGGDFYDFVELPNDHVGIAIGDVAGRGIAAAIYLARLISDFRTAAVRAESPHAALERLNQQLLARSTRGMFVTMAYLVLNPVSGEVSYSTGGHLPILLRTRGECPIEILREDEGLPLGISVRPRLFDRRLQLDPGATLLLVTDGVIEALSDNHGPITFDKLAEVFCRVNPPGDRVVDAVFEEIRKHSRAPYEDDMTAVSLSWFGTRSGAAS